MDNIVYDNGAFYVYSYTWNENDNIYTAYGIKKTDRPQDGMLFSHTDKYFCIDIADKYKNIITKENKT